MIRPPTVAPTTSILLLSILPLLLPSAPAAPVVASALSVPPIPPRAPRGSRGGGGCCSYSSSSRPLLRGGPYSRFVGSSASSSDIPASGGDEDGDGDGEGGRHRAIVVGGGPVGLAAALVLGNSPHSYDVTILESTSGDASTIEYDPTKAYLYNVNGRGQTLTRRFPSVQTKLEERGVKGMGSGYVEVPADPSAPLPERKTFAIPTFKGSGGDDASPSYWIPRHGMVKLMYEAVLEHEEEREREREGEEGGEGSGRGRISYAAGKECVGLNPTRAGEDAADAEQMVAVTVRDGDTGEETTHAARLVIGCDGYKSKVRDCLLRGGDAFASWPGFDRRKFEVKRWTSPATDLRIKVLQFPPQFKIPDADGTSLTTTSETMYVLRCRDTRPLSYVNLGLLPMRDNSDVRPTNVITRPNHVIWTIRTGEEMRLWFRDQFPRLPFGAGTDSLVPSEEWERFAEAEGTKFPHCQYSPGMVAHSPGGECGVALCGDSVHAFPPDVGQGINAGLMDVVELDRALRGGAAADADGKSGEGEGEGAPQDVNLAEALERYQRVRGPEVKALIRFSRFGSPYQYRQPLRIDRLGRGLWTINLLLRLALNRVTFGVVPPQAMMLAQDPSRTFRSIMRREDLTTAVLAAAAGWGAVRVLGRWGAVGGAASALRGALGRALGILSLGP